MNAHLTLLSSATRSLLLALLVLMVFSCSNVPEKVDFAREELNEDILNEAEPLKAEPLWTSDELSLAVRDCYVYKDSVLVVVNSLNGDGPFVQIFDLFTHDSIAHYLAKGKGRGEVLSAETALLGNILVVNDFMGTQMCYINLDSAVSDKNYAPAIVRHNFGALSSVLPYKGEYLVDNPYCFTSEELGVRQGIEYGTPRFVRAKSLEEGFKESDIKNYEYFTGNATSSGQIVINEEKGRIVYGSMLKSELEFYDGDLRLLKRVDGPAKIEESFTISGTNNGLPDVCCKGFIPYAYMSSCSDNQSVYLNYLGQCLTVAKDRKEIEEMESYILRFDWDGNFEKCYKVGRNMRTFTRSTVAPETFYATVYDDSMNLCLMKLSAR